MVPTGPGGPSPLGGSSDEPRRRGVTVSTRLRMFRPIRRRPSQQPWSETWLCWNRPTRGRTNLFHAWPVGNRDGVKAVHPVPPLAVMVGEDFAVPAGLFVGAGPHVAVAVEHAPGSHRVGGGFGSAHRSVGLPRRIFGRAASPGRSGLGERSRHPICLWLMVVPAASRGSYI